MGGEIGVDSQEGIGSTFWFHIPFGYAPPPMSASPATDTGTDLSRSTRRGLLLLVEDNVVNQKIAVAMLVKQGHIVDVAQNGEQALSLLAIRPYDLVLMDCHMPVMDGYEATRRLRANDPPVLNPCVPVIAMTASALIEDQQRCIFTGMNDFISKPFKAEHLHQIVGRFLEKHPHDTALFNPTPSIWSDNKPVPCLERYGHI